MLLNLGFENELACQDLDILAVHFPSIDACRLTYRTFETVDVGRAHCGFVALSEMQDRSTGCRYPIDVLVDKELTVAAIE